MGCLGCLGEFFMSELSGIEIVLRRLLARRAVQPLLLKLRSPDVRRGGVDGSERSGNALRTSKHFAKGMTHSKTLCKSVLDF